MIYVYDDALISDLKRVVNPDNLESPSIRVVSPEDAIGLAAQLQDDDITFPIIALFRKDDTGLDTTRTNFTAMHTGVESVMDTEKNLIYSELVVPIHLSYDLTLLTTNQVDMDELIRELVFHYTRTYFLTARIPYESRRKFRFGVVIDKENEIQRSSGNREYIEGGTLYQSIIPLKIEGAITVHYVPAKLRRTTHQIIPE